MNKILKLSRHRLYYSIVFNCHNVCTFDNRSIEMSAAVSESKPLAGLSTIPSRGIYANKILDRSPAYRPVSICKHTYDFIMIHINVICVQMLGVHLLDPLRYWCIIML